MTPFAPILATVLNRHLAHNRFWKSSRAGTGGGSVRSRRVPGRGKRSRGPQMPGGRGMSQRNHYARRVLREEQGRVRRASPRAWHLGPSAEPGAGPGCSILGDACAPRRPAPGRAEILSPMGPTAGGGRGGIASSFPSCRFAGQPVTVAKSMSRTRGMDEGVRLDAP